MSRARGSLVLHRFVAAFAITAVTATSLAAPREARTLRIGYTTFRSADDIERGRSSLESLTRYLEVISERSWKQSSDFAEPVAFDVVLGNYYQIYSWLKDGYLDGAIVSPFVAQLLGDQYYLPVADLIEDLSSPVRGGQFSIVSCHGDSCDGGPRRAFDRHLEGLLCRVRATRDEPVDCSSLPAYDLDLVAHLSASGFIAPLVYAAGWLSEQALELPAAAEQDFWDRYFASMHLRFGHDRVAGSTDSTSTLSFTYSGSSETGSGEALPLIIPHDVLVVRRTLASRLTPHRQLDRVQQIGALPTLQNMWIPSAEQARARISRDDGYRDVRAYDFAAHTQFARKVEATFDDSRVLGQLADLWYARGKYSFTIAELTRFLKQDQATSGKAQLALVLPGGGVKAAYQAELLDSLYAEHLINPGPPCDKVDAADCTNACLSGGRGDERTLCVDAIVGTSGGALTGVFAAMQTSESQKQLSSLWFEDGEARISGGDLFGRFDILGWAGLLATFLIFCAAVQIGYVSERGYERFGDVQLDAQWPSKRLAGSLLAVTALGPIAVAYLKGFGEYEQVLSIEGGMYALLLVVCHGVLSCTHSGAARQPRLAGHARTFAIVSLMLLAGPFLWRGAIGRDLQGTMTFNAGLLVAVWTLYLYNYRWRGDAARDVPGYIRSLILPLGLAAIAQGLVYLFSRWGYGSMLELTLGYWGRLLGISAIASVLIIAWVLYVPRRLVPEVLLETLRFWVRRHGVLFLRLRRMWSMAAFLLVGIFWWNWWLAPGLYGNEGALCSFEKTLARYQATDGVPADVECGRESARILPLQTMLVVTAASIGEAEDLYFCFEVGGNCGTDRGRTGAPHLQGNQPTYESVLHLVFASGAAFPIYPAHKVPGGKFLIDGGYGANIPLEAAALTGARQVLVVHSSPDPELLELYGPPRAAPLRISGELARSAIEFFPFLFEKLQQGDVRVRNELVVAEVYPDASGGAFPFLADFRDEVIEDMVLRARADLDGRIGQIQDWGLPGRPARHIESKPADRR